MTTQTNRDRPQNAATVEQEPLTGGQKYILAIMLSLTLFLTALDSTITTASLPQISADLKSSAGYTWIGTGYLLASASTMPVYGKLSDIWGRKPILLGAIVIFLAGSAIGGAAVSMQMLIIARVVQGLGGGGIAGLVNVVISDMVPLKQRGLFMGFTGSTYMVASCIGPLVGGALTQIGKWRWCFYLNLPIGGIAFANLFVFLKLKSPKTSFFEGVGRIDTVGIILSTGATCLLLFALDWGGTKYPWSSPKIIACLVFAGLTFVLFLVYEQYFPSEPLVPPRIFMERTRATSLAGSFCHSLSFMGVIYYVPFMFQSVFGVTPIMSSIYLIPQAVLLGLTSAMGGAMISRTGKYVWMMRIGLSITCIFLGVMTTLTPHSNTAKRIIYVALYGAPVGLNFQSFLISLQTRIEREDIAIATTTLAYVRQVGLSLGISIGGVAFQNKVSSLANKSGEPSIQRLLSGNAPMAVNAVKQLPQTLQSLARSYYLDAFKIVFYVFAAFAGLGVIVSMFIPENELKMIGEGDKKPAVSESKQVDDDESELDSTSHSHYSVDLDDIINEYSNRVAIPPRLSLNDKSIGSIEVWRDSERDRYFEDLAHWPQRD